MTTDKAEDGKRQLTEEEIYRKNNK